jgi:subtilisin family serine protease
MKKLLALITVIVAFSVIADDFYWSLGQKRKITKQNNLAVVKKSNSQLPIGASTLKALNIEIKEWPLEFEHAAIKYQLLSTDFSKLKFTEEKNQYILPVYKNELDQLFCPTENIIIGINKNEERKQIETLAKKYNLKLKSFNSPMPGMAVLTVPNKLTDKIVELANKLRNEKITRWAHPDSLAPHYKRAVVNDPLFDIQWHLTNDGHLAGATLGADAKVAGAWNTTMGTSSVRVCIFDDSVEMNHEDLSNNFVAGLNLDDMGPDPSPRVFEGENAEEHGTACSGVAVARGNNGIGVSGAAPYCSLMGIRWGTTGGDDTAGFFWARTNGADIISCSWGTTMSDALYEAIRDAAVNGRNGLGCPIFFAAGNSGSEVSKFDPARHPYVICVMASNAQDKRASYSSYGDVASIAAPSNDSSMPGITTTDDTGAHGYSSDNYCRATDDTGFGGTSSATPLAAGIGALCLSVNSNLTYLNVKSLLQETADKIDSSTHAYNSAGWNEYLGYGRINAERAVQLAPNYTNTPFAFVSAKGKINAKAKKIVAKLEYLSGILAGYKGEVTVELDGNVVATFDSSLWKWNKKNIKGKNKSIDKNLIKITAKSNKKQIIIKIKNLSYVPSGNTAELTIAFTGGQIGKINLALDTKGKFKQ